MLLSSCIISMRVTQSGHVKTGIDHMPYRGHTMFTYTSRVQTEVPTFSKLVLILKVSSNTDFTKLWNSLATVK